MNAGRPLRFWLIGLGLFVFALWLFSGMLLPFVAGMAIAYFLDPVVDRLERWNLPRWLATSVVLLFFAVVLVLALLLIVPLIQVQVAEFLHSLPQYVEQMRERIVPVVRRLARRLSDQDVERLRDAAGQFAADSVHWAGRVVTTILSGGFALFDVLSLMFITPVVAFYLLRDWDRMIGSIDRCLPRPYAEIIHEQARAIDHTLAGFVRGQATVCLVLGLFYAIALTLAGLNFGLVVGLIAGLVSFIPYVGTLVGFVAGTGIALVQFESFWSVGLIVGIFLFGQTMEGYVLGPKLVGERVGLHPVWVMFALLAGASLFGFVGVLIAMPVAAAIGVLVRFGVRQYLGSPYFRGSEGRGSEGQGLDGVGPR